MSTRAIGAGGRASWWSRPQPNRAKGARGDARATLSVVAMFAAGLLCCITACQRKSEPPPRPAPPAVTVARPLVQSVEDTQEFTGTARASQQVEVRSRVRGFILTRPVQGGQRVKKGDTLFTIDPRTFEAGVRQAQANVDARVAQLKLAEVTLERVSGAVAENAAPKLEKDRASAERDQAKAQKELAEAALAQAQLDLDWTTVTAPIDGRLGVDLPDVGNLVDSTPPTLLATIADDRIVYVRYAMAQRVLETLRKGATNRRPGEDGRPELLVRMGLETEPGYPRTGRFDKADIGVEPGTGTILIESVFENADGTVLPGMTARLQAVFGEREALLVPDAAVQRDPLGAFVLVVTPAKADAAAAAGGAASIAERRKVTLGPIVELTVADAATAAGSAAAPAVPRPVRMRRIDSGLEPTDWVIVNGLASARAGQGVTPTETVLVGKPATPPAK